MTKNTGTYFAIIAAVSLLCVSAEADIIHLKNGGKIHGLVIGDTRDAVTIDMGVGTVTHKKEEIASIEKGPFEPQADRIRDEQSVSIELKPKTRSSSMTKDFINACAYILRLEFLRKK